ncbi:DNA replication protein psf2 [Tulasnella sp. 419]|nr:DNA replication protein psf2 [Tulasnella sp. 419]
MALPNSLRISTTPYELEFIACEEEIEIIPQFSMERIRLLSGVYGPFRPPGRARIPLWLAVHLKSRRKCHIVPPTWLSVDILQQKLNEETSNEHFSELPFRYVEISKVLLDAASDDLDVPDKIRSLLKDIREARQAKSRDGLRELDHIHTRMQNICSMEINEIRPFFSMAMNVFTKLTPSKQEEEEEPFDMPVHTGTDTFSAMDESMDTDW